MKIQKKLFSNKLSFFVVMIFLLSSLFFYKNVLGRTLVDDTSSGREVITSIPVFAKIDVKSGIRILTVNELTNGSAAQFDSSVKILAGQTLQFSAINSTGNSLRYEWIVQKIDSANPSSLLGSSQQVDFFQIFSGPGNYKVQLDVYDSTKTGAEAHDSLYLTFYVWDNPPVAKISVISDGRVLVVNEYENGVGAVFDEDIKVFVGQELNFSAKNSIGNILSYTWLIGKNDGSNALFTGTGNQVNYVFSGPGEYKVQLGVHDGSKTGTSADDSLILYFYVWDNPSVAQIYTTLGGRTLQVNENNNGASGEFNADTKILAGQILSFGSAGSIGSALEYTWLIQKIDGVSAQTIQTYNTEKIEYRFSNSGNYRVQLDIYDKSKTGSSAYDNFVLNFYVWDNPPIAKINIYSGNRSVSIRENGNGVSGELADSEIFYMGDTLRFRGLNSVGGELEYTWIIRKIDGSVPNTLLTRVSESVDFTFITPGYYHVQLDILDKTKSGSSARDSLYITFSILEKTNFVQDNAVITTPPTQPDQPKEEIQISNPNLLDSNNQNVITVEPIINGVIQYEPIARDDYLNTNKNKSLNISVSTDILKNDSDANGDSVFVSNYYAPEHGYISVISLNNIAYNPNTNFIGQDRFSYSISDGKGGQDTAYVYVNVLNVMGTNDTIDSDQNGLVENIGNNTNINNNQDAESVGQIGSTQKNEFENQTNENVVQDPGNTGSASEVSATKVINDISSGVVVSDGSPVTNGKSVKKGLFDGLKSFLFGEEKKTDLPNENLVDVQALEILEETMIEEPKYFQVKEGELVGLKLKSFSSQQTGSRLEANLPAGAFIIEKGDGRWQFGWLPGYGQSGIYNVEFKFKNGEEIFVRKVTFDVVDNGVAGDVIDRNQPMKFLNEDYLELTALPEVKDSSQVEKQGNINLSGEEAVVNKKSGFFGNFFGNIYKFLERLVNKFF